MNTRKEKFGEFMVGVATVAFLALFVVLAARQDKQISDAFKGKVVCNKVTGQCVSTQK